MKMILMILIAISIEVSFSLHSREINDMRNAFSKGINQKWCGSCWAMASSQYLAAFYTLNEKITNPSFQPPQISPDFFIDCQRENSPIKWIKDGNVGNQGCDGGRPGLSMIFAQHCMNRDIPLPTIDSYPLASGMFPHSAKKMNERCQAFIDNHASDAVPSYQRVITNYKADLKLKMGSNDELRQLIDEVGPIMVSISLDPRIVTMLSQMIHKNDEIYYSIKDCQPPEKVNHAVVIAGYTKLEVKGIMKKVWIVRNSWENDKNPNTFIYIDAEIDNLCGVLQEVTFLRHR